jgi:ketosteroid isomerase-like protein
MGSATSAARADTLARAVAASLCGDSETVAALATDDVVARTPTATVLSALALAVEVEDRASAFSDVDVELDALDVAGDRAVVEWTATMTHTGAFLLRDDVVLAATGVRCSLHGVTVADFDGPRIRALREYWDETALVEQLAAATAPA